MQTESGDMKLLGNFRNLVDFVTAETGFKPANDKIKPAALEAQYTTALSAAGEVPATMAQYKAAVNDRQSTRRQPIIKSGCNGAPRPAQARVVPKSTSSKCPKGLFGAG